jgi:2-polyprenyl-3-methyl-5-hydroxy-6-metoxy-1,4-benzoquinol methylase
VYIREQVKERDLLSIYAGRESHHNNPEKLEWDFSPVKSRLYYARILKRIERYIEPGPMLDIGCSNGSFAVAALQRGWQAKGLELEKSSIATAEAHGVPVFAGTLEEQKFAANSFHAVTMWNLFEHVSDPVAVLDEVHRILQPGGICAMCVPNIRSVGWWLLGADWHSVEPQIHMNLFSARTLGRLVRSRNFKPRRIVTLDLKPATLRTWLKRKTKRKEQSHAASVARMAQQSPRRLALLLRLRAIVNLPLIVTRSGEDIFCYIQKPIGKDVSGV